MQTFNNSNNLNNYKNNKNKQVFNLIFFILTFLLASNSHILIKNFVLSKIFSIFWGIISLYFLNKAYIIPKKCHFILRAIIFIFIFISFLSLFLI